MATARRDSPAARLLTLPSRWAGDIRYQALAALISALLVIRLPTLPSLQITLFSLAGLVVSMFAVRAFRSRSSSFLMLLAPWVITAAYCMVLAHSLLAERLPTSEHGTQRWLQGQIIEIPESQLTSRGKVVRFLFSPGDDSLRRIRVAWYQSPVQPRAGECWNLLLRLRTPRGSVNPGTLDYEGWLFQQRIGATASVREGRRCPESDSMGLQQVRQAIADGLRTGLSDHPMQPFMLGLTLGERSDISNTQWAVLRRTGTAHLLAISGLHIGLVAGFAFLLVSYIWRYIPGLSLRMPAPKAAAMAAAIAGLAYAALAGFGLPAQRALVMLMIVLVGVLLGERLQASRLLAIALLVIIVIDPFSVTSAGFWLSFAAVGWIFYVLRARLAQTAGWRSWLWLQVVLGCGLLPLTLFWFGEGSSISPLVNLLLIPLFFVIVPLVLVSSLLALAAQALNLSVSGLLLLLPASLLDWIWQGLVWVDAWAQPIPSGPAVGWLAVVIACLGFGWFFAPRAWPARWLGLLLCLPLAVPLALAWADIESGQTPVGSVDVTVLDVGQGLAVVMRTAEHVLVYDAGPAYESGFDAGAMVVVPYLRSQGVQQVNLYLESHGDMDHRGGSTALRREFVVLDELGSRNTAPCRTGQAWQWDEVRFEVMHPDASGWQGNNASCVLRVIAGSQTMLLTGDIERSAELVLISSDNDLNADVLIVPHHGSATSSSIGLLNRTAPSIAIVSAGWRNRWGFPKQAVVERYFARDIRLLNTADSGAISLRLGSRAGLGAVVEQRKVSPRFWHAPG